MRRLLAVLGAVAMVGAAIAIRGAIDDDGGDGADDGSVTVVCSADLAPFCEQLEGVEVELLDAAETAQRLGSGDTLSGADGWVTTTAWAEVVESRAPDAIVDGRVIARTPVAVAADPARGAPLQALCGDQPILGCLGDHAGSAWDDLGGERAWGDLRTGLPDADSAIGLPLLAAAAIGFFGHADFATNDFETRDLRGWLGRLAQPSGAGDADPASTLVTRRGTYSAAITTAARLGDLGDRADALEVAPAVDVTVAILLPRGTDDGFAFEELRDAFVADGWSAADGDIDDLPEPILKPGVLAALHTLWTEVIR